MSANMKTPPAQLAHLVKLLGWAELRTYKHRSRDEDPPRVITWYESGRSEGLSSDVFLQINPQSEAGEYAAAVYAMRYRICSGWRRFTLHESKHAQTAAASLDGWVHRRWFESASMRREYRQSHPECANYTWVRIREQGPPYWQDGTATTRQ